MRPTVVAVVGAAAVVASLAACTPSAPEPASDVGVQLFEWTWDAIAAECPHLGEAGYGWVLTSPPQEHVLGSQWWTQYQPVSYQVESRLGTRDEFEQMVGACHDAGVQVIADAVINHMAGSESGTGWAGSTFTHYEYPGLWTYDDFHHCDAPDGDIADYRDATQVQTCELVNLADLATDTEPVRARLSEYLLDLRSLGVDGFRIDAAKHMAAEDVAAILEPLPDDTVVLQEVIYGDGEPITPEQYLGNGSVFDFQYAWDLERILRNGRLASLLEARASGLPAESSVLFVTNHDTERNAQTLSYRDAARFELATVLMLAGDDGTPMVYSGYAFDDRDAGPDQDADGAVLDASCAADAGPGADVADGGWVCEHRWPAIQAMVGWRATVGDAPVTDTWADGGAVAWSRDGRGFVAANAGDPTTVTIPTSLPDDTYCDVLTGGAGEDGCLGTAVEVSGGEATVTLDTLGAVALEPDATAGS
ncbi:alpha-amylase family protein [Actinotalea sp. M2MS4P-6]|uniref:alpha-amylase n=1 Tax=Actinotalea sp. M2MS4P-6 TaxID=2983762 RepID=UPI0021E46E81|nr:alpha-amylase family protein [Actinotalea sp. M2MS4P-6]MCV2393890.1 alpha-amylase family protein [Actinotalea sp. M2MS4P-6]